MSDGNGPRMLRMVRWQSVVQDAARLRDWRSQDPINCLSRIVHMGDARTARRALLEWFNAKCGELLQDPEVTSQDFVVLRSLYWEYRAKIAGRMAVMDTELGYHSQNVGPDADRSVFEYESWCNRYNLGALFDEGFEVIITGHMGAGKSHLAVSLMEYVLRLMKAPKVHVITNISGVRDTTGRFNDRIHRVALLSEILRIWTGLPDGTRIVLFLDEPETNLRGGSSKSVRLFKDFRHMLRKLGMAKLEIWHSESEIYKQLREAQDERITRISKTDKHAMDVQRTTVDGEHKFTVQGIHELRCLEYSHRGMASIAVDVAMDRLINRLSKIDEVPDMKMVVRAALTDPRYYVDGFKPDVAGSRSKKVGPSDEEIIAAILADVPAFLTQARHVDHLQVREAWSLTHRHAQAVAREATQRWRSATPEWRSVEPSRSRRRGPAGSASMPVGGVDEEE